MADVTKINGYIIKDANAPHPSNAGSAGQVLKKTETGTEWADESGGSSSTTQTITLSTSGWTLGGNRYYQEAAVSGISINTPVVLVDVSLTGTDLDADVLALEAWSLISANNVAQGSGTLTFYSYAVPSVNIPVNVGVV